MAPRNSKEKRGKHARHQELGVDQQQDHESPEDEEVVQPEFFAHHPPLAEGVHEHASQTGPEVIKAVFPLAQAEEGEEPENIPWEKADAAHQQDGKDEGFYGAQGNSFIEGTGRVQGQGQNSKPDSDRSATG